MMRKQSYDDFAWFYARHWNEQYHGAAFPILERILLSRLKRGARVLDVCCGTGHLAGRLNEQAFSVTGLTTGRAGADRAPGEARSGHGLGAGDDSRACSAVMEGAGSAGRTTGTVPSAEDATGRAMADADASPEHCTVHESGRARPLKLFP